jgi:hypothetical protein
MTPEQTERELFRRMLDAGRDCPPIETLERLLAPDAPRDLVEHLESCSYCRTEVELLRTFYAEPRNEAESEAIRTITERLRRMPPFVVATAPAQSTEPWWRWLFQTRWLSPAAMAMAGVLIAVAVGVEWRQSGRPEIHAPNPQGQGALRSGSFEVIFPTGDLREVPTAIRWQPATGAMRYEVRLLEVDRHEVWKTTAADPQADIPAQVQALILPAKTLVLEITALDAAGREVARSEPARFRLLQKVYTR